MRYILSFLLLFATLSIHAHNRVSKVLGDLDRKIEERYLYRVEKDRRIDALKFSFCDCVDPLQESTICHQLFEEYKTYQYDSAYLYALRMREFAVESGSAELIAQSNSDILYCYSTAGFFREGAEIISEFSPEGVSSNGLANFYRGCIRYYFNLMRYVGSTRQLTALYREEMLRSTALTLENLSAESFDYKFIDVQSDILLGDDSQQSVDKVQALLSTSNLSLNNKAILYSWLGMAYEKLEDREAAIYYTALSAIADIESCTYETTSAKDLAEYMYNLNDINRAARYIKLALADANTYNSPYRKLEIQAIMPEITDQRLYDVEQERRSMAIFSAIIILLLLIIIVMMLNIQKRNLALRRARVELEERAAELATMNDRLEGVNSELSEANKIKDRYIIESLYSDSAFVDSVEKMCKVLVRKIKVKQYNELLDLIGGISIKQERQRMSTTFDSAFLKLFPNFIEEYNKLFEADQALSLGESGELSAEMRIFALIRLGIEDVNLISRYLNLSLNTVYVYKAKAKARAIVPKEEFEERIKAIIQLY
ncbi:MAG: DUF6377 domain-containing protein [Rikenellaceae bacterium]